MEITRKTNPYTQDILLSSKHIRLGSKHKGEYVLKDKIIYIEACECYSWLYLVDGTKILSCKPIGYHEEKLADDGFIRIHRSYLIHLRHLKTYEQKYRLVHLKGEIVLPVSFRKNRQLSKMMHNQELTMPFRAAV